MTEVTDVDYEVEEREVTRYKCDQCKDVVDEDAINVEAIFNTTQPAMKQRIDEWRHICDDCANRERYGTLVDMWGKKKRLAEIVGASIDKLGTTGSHLLAAAFGASFSFSYIYVKFSPEVYGNVPLEFFDWVMVALTTFMATIIVTIVSAAIASQSRYIEGE